MNRDHRRLLVVSFLLTALASCGGNGGSSTPPVQPVGSLTVNVSAPPSGTATVMVSGPGNFAQSFSQTTTLTNLDVGTYSVVAATISGAPGTNLVYVPTVTGNPAAVTANATATANVSFNSLSTVWQPIGPRAIHILNGIPAAGKLDALAIDNSSSLVTVGGTQIHSVMYVAGGIYNGPSSEPGVYKTTDGGVTWSQASNGLTDPAVGALWLDQTNHDTLVAASWTQGLFQSTDAGQTWTLTGPYGSSAALLQVGSTLYAGTGQGIYTSADSGATWTELEPTSVPVRSLASSGTTIYAGLDDGSVAVQTSPSGQWLFNTPDSSAGLTSESIAINPLNAQNAYSVEMGYYNIPNFYVTANSGTLWSAISTNALNVPVQVTAFDPFSGAIYIGADVYFGKSADGGNTWAQMAAPGPTNAGAWYDERLIVPDAGGISGDVMITADQGLYLTVDGGNTWQSLNGNLTTSIVYVAAVHGSTIICTMQDLGPVSSFDGGQTWDSHQSNNPGYLEGGTSLINPGNPQYAYIYTAAGFQFSSDGGYNYQVTGNWTNNAFPGYGGNSQLIAVDPQNSSIVYAVAQSDVANGVQQGVYKSTNYGQTWSLLNWPINEPVMIAIDPTNDQNIFVGQADGNLQITHNGGQSWKANPIGQTNGQVWWPVTLAVNPSTPNVVLLGMSGPPGAGGGALRSTDGGNTFVPANNGLDQGNPQPWPDSIFRLSYDPAGSGIAVATRFSGIYISTDNGNNWISIRSTAIPYTFTSAAWDSGYLYATTFGEGVIRLSGPF